MTPSTRQRPRLLASVLCALLLVAPRAHAQEAGAGPTRARAQARAPAPDGYERSLRWAEEALARHPGHPAILSVQAQIQFRRGRFAEALKLHEALIAARPENLDARLGAAECLHRLGQLERAVEVYSRLLQARPPPGLEAQARRGLTEALLKLGRLAEALAQVELTLEKGDRSADMYLLQAQILDGSSKERALEGEAAAAADADQRAAGALETALRLEPDLASAHYLLATIARRRGDAAAARSHLEKFLATRKPEAPTGNDELRVAEARFEMASAIALGRALLAIGDAPAAERFSALALEACPREDEAQAFRAWALWRAGRSAEAGAAYEALLARSPRHPEALWNLGKLRLEEGRPADAAPLLLAGAEARGDAPDAWELLAELSLSGRALPARAAEFARRALAARRSPEAYALLARALVADGRGEEARGVLAEGARAFPDAEALRDALEAIGSARP